MHDKEWKNMAKSILKSELAKKNIDYQRLSSRLIRIGVTENAPNINSKINRGSFSFIFFLQCMQAINTNSIHIDAQEGNNEK